MLRTKPAVTAIRERAWARPTLRGLEPTSTNETAVMMSADRRRAHHHSRIEYAKARDTSTAAAVKGEEACIDTSTGLLTVGGTSTTLLPVGRFAETLTGDGVKKCRVTLPNSFVCEVWNNDAVVAVAP